MLYQHRVEFQELLQKALTLAVGQTTDYSDARFIQAGAGKLEFSKNKLNRFRNATFPLPVDSKGSYAELRRKDSGYLDPKSSEQLWNYLDSLGFIEKARDDFDTGRLCDSRFAANVLGEFYGHDTNETKTLNGRGLETKYFCYKPSSRKPGCIVKSRIEITFRCGEYFDVSEYQRASGRYEVQGLSTDERSQGFGFVRADWLWLFLKEESRQQPRVFCFYEWDLEVESSNVAGGDPSRPVSHLALMRGRILEGDRRFTDEVYGFRVGLASVSADRRLWERQHPNEPYDEGQQVDNFPFSETAKKTYHADDRICLDPVIMGHICGTRDDQYTSRL